MTTDSENHWQHELNSLAIECKRTNELNNKEELKGLATAIKDVLFSGLQNCIDDNHGEIDKSHFDHII